MKTVIITAVLLLSAAMMAPNCQAKLGWRDSFSVDKSDLGPTGSNTYFILQPGYKLFYEHGKSALIRTVLDETKMVDGVEVRVVEDRETENGQIIEVARDFFAIDEKTEDVYYFGEDVDNYKAGKVVSHGGSWRSGVKSAHFGLQMPGKPKLGYRFYQELAPGTAMDRAKVVGVNEELKVPAGTFKGCVRFKESSAIERGTSEKWYAPGVGMIKDDEFDLVKIQRPAR